MWLDWSACSPGAHRSERTTRPRRAASPLQITALTSAEDDESLNDCQPEHHARCRHKVSVLEPLNAHPARRPKNCQRNSAGESPSEPLQRRSGHILQVHFGTTRYGFSVCAGHDMWENVLSSGERPAQTRLEDSSLAAAGDQQISFPRRGMWCFAQGNLNRFMGCV